MGFEAVESGVAADREFLLAGLAHQILNVLLLAMKAIADQGMDALIHNAVVDAFGVVAGITLGVDGFLASSPTAHFTPRRRRRGKHQCVGGSSFFSLTQVAIVFALGLERPGCLGLGFFGNTPRLEDEQGGMEEGADERGEMRVESGK